MVSKPFSFRLPDEAVEILESRKLEGETLNQAAQRVLLEALNVNTTLNADVNANMNADVYTTVDIQKIVKQEVEASFNELQSQLEELRVKSKAR